MAISSYDYLKIKNIIKVIALNYLDKHVIINRYNECSNKKEVYYKKTISRINSFPTALFSLSSKLLLA